MYIYYKIYKKCMASEEQEQQDITPDIKNLTYEMVLSRHIDRILSLTIKDFQDENNKLLAYHWAVRMLKASIPKEIQKGLTVEEIEFSSKDNYLEQFKKIENMFMGCINILAENGYLYSKIGYGGY